MSGLENYDAILIAPTTRNTMAKIANGILDSPLLMAISAAKTNNTPVVLVPSMHNSMADDKKTADLVLLLGILVSKSCGGILKNKN